MYVAVDVEIIVYTRKSRQPVSHVHRRDRGASTSQTAVRTAKVSRSHYRMFDRVQLTERRHRNR
jgi:hypothetical protein